MNTKRVTDLLESKQIGELQTKHDPTPRIIHSIIMGGQSMSLRNNKENTQTYIIFDEDWRKELDDHTYANKIVIKPYIPNAEVKIIDIMKVINYFVGKGYRVTKSMGHGDEQMQFLRLTKKDLR